jgi:hypothetical protein
MKGEKMKATIVSLDQVEPGSMVRIADTGQIVYKTAICRGDIGKEEIQVHPVSSNKVVQKQISIWMSKNQQVKI